jgi:hypothetical protein
MFYVRVVLFSVAFIAFQYLYFVTKNVKKKNIGIKKLKQAYVNIIKEK